MAEVFTSAPAKVILFGEHLVVHGATALTTALDLRTYVRLSSLQSVDQPSIHINLPDIKADVTIPIADLCYTGSLSAWDDPEKSANEQLLTFLEKPAQGNKGVVAVLFLIVSIGGSKLKEVGSFSVHVRSEFQPGVGLGSSGAFNVALSSGLLRFFGHASAKDDVEVPHALGSARGWTDIKKPSETVSVLINRWAYAAETIMHGQPSGIDNSISTFGGAVAFQSGKISVIHEVPPLKLAVTNTKVPRSTKILVGNVGILRKRFPAVFDPLIQSVESISKTTLSIFESYVSTTETSQHQELESQFQALMDVNQGILNAIGVGHPALDLVVKLSMSHNLHSKLTGAGGGGCAITFLPTGTSSTTIEALRSDLSEAGFDCFDAKIGASGVLQHTTTPVIFN
jgi:mevalonate kinase